MDESLQQRLLDAIQSGFPIEVNPYDVLANRFDVSVDEIMDAIRAMYAGGGVRRIGASFDSRKLGYTSTLCALAVPGGEEELARAAEIVNAVPGVTHNYGRNHRYNMWFTLIIRSEEEKQKILASIREKTGYDDLLDMPSTKRFKISVDFGKQRAEAQRGHTTAMHRTTDDYGKPIHEPTGEAVPDLKGYVTAEQSSSLVETEEDAPFNADDPFDVELVRWAQGDIARDEAGELYDDPFEVGLEHIKEALNRDDISIDDLLLRMRQLKSDRTIRRFGAMVRHQRIGFAHNSMTVWDVPDDQVDAAGKLFANAPFVSHCYTRTRYESWPTNLYAMTHAETAEDLQENIASLRQMLEDAGITYHEHRTLESTDEFKKISMSYFMEDSYE